jgi:hypothetical protein
MEFNGDEDDDLQPPGKKQVLDPPSPTTTGIDRLSTNTSHSFSVNDPVAERELFVVLALSVQFLVIKSPFIFATQIRRYLRIGSLTTPSIIVLLFKLILYPNILIPNKQQLWKLTQSLSLFNSITNC